MTIFLMLGLSSLTVVQQSISNCEGAIVGHIGNKNYFARKGFIFKTSTTCLGITVLSDIDILFTSITCDNSLFNLNYTRK